MFSCFRVTVITYAKDSRNHEKFFFHFVAGIRISYRMYSSRCMANGLCDARENNGKAFTSQLYSHLVWDAKMIMEREREREFEFEFLQGHILVKLAHAFTRTDTRPAWHVPRIQLTHFCYRCDNYSRPNKARQSTIQGPDAGESNSPSHFPCYT